MLLEDSGVRSGPWHLGCSLGRRRIISKAYTHLETSPESRMLSHEDKSSEPDHENGPASLGLPSPCFTHHFREERQDPSSLHISASGPRQVG